MSWRGDAVGQGQEGLQPGVLGVAEVLDVVPGLGPGDDGTDGEGDDVEQFVEAGAEDAARGTVDFRPNGLTSVRKQR